MKEEKLVAISGAGAGRPVRSARNLPLCGWCI